MTEERLMPCGCGGDAVLFQSSDGDVEYVHCLVCAKEGPRHYSSREAIAAWNTRQPTPAADEVEAVARAIHGAKMVGHNPDCLYQHHDHEDWPVDDRREYADPFTGEPRVQLFHKAWRRYETAALAAIAAMQARSAEKTQTPIEEGNSAGVAIETAAHAGEEPVAAIIEAHCHGGLRQLYDRTAGSIPVKAAVGCHCACGESFSGTDEQEVTAQWSAHVAALLPSATPSNPDRLVGALRGLYSAVNTRAVRGRDHVPSMREEQKAMLEALKALSAAQDQGEGK